MNKFKIAFTAALALCLALPTFSASAAGPADTVTMLQKAIDTRDTALMDRYIDLDAVIGKAVDAVLADTDAVRQAEQSSPVVALVLSGLGSDARTKSVAKQLLSAESRQFVRYGVSSGAFAGTAKPGPHSGAGLLSSNLRGGAKDKKTFGRPEVRKQSATAATVSTSLFDAGNNETYPLELGMQQKDGVWQVTELANIHALIKRGTGTKSKSKDKQ